MKKLIFILITSGFCLFLFQHCKEDRNQGTIRFTDEERNIIPYHGGEHLVFRDSLGDSASFDVEAPVYYFINKNDPGTGDNFNTEICDVKPLYIGIGFFFVNSHPQLILSIYNFQFKNHPEITSQFDGDWLYNSGKLYFTKTGWWGWSGINYFDSLTIVNKKFYSVYNLVGWATTTDSTQIYRNVYYTMHQGIVGVKTINGSGTFRRWFLD